MEISKKIHDARIAKGIGQTKLSELSGVSVRTIRNIERGTFVPTLNNLLSLCEHLDLEISLMRREEHKNE